LTNSQILQIFRLYKAAEGRQFHNQNVTFLFSGTLLILITTMFMNACSAKIAYNLMKPNHVVMNTVIASAAAGCHIFMHA
jgi:ammonia channel protein AmtB